MKKTFQHKIDGIVLDIEFNYYIEDFAIIECYLTSVQHNGVNIIELLSSEVIEGLEDTAKDTL